MGEDFIELRSSCFNVGYVRYGFPDEIGEMFRDHKVCDMSSEGGSRFDDLGPIRVVIVEGSLMMSWAAVVSFVFGTGRLKAFNGIREVLSIRARKIMWVKLGRKIIRKEFDDAPILFLLKGRA